MYGFIIFLHMAQWLEPTLRRFKNQPDWPVCQLQFQSACKAAPRDVIFPDDIYSFMTDAACMDGNHISFAILFQV